MKTLEEMYFSEIDKQPEHRPILTDIFFISAFPGTNIVKKVREVKRGSEDQLDDFYDGWTERLKTKIKEGLEAGMQPEILAGTLPITTREDLKDIIRGIDKYIVGDTEEILAIKITELESHAKYLMQLATQIFQDEIREFQVNQQKGKIIKVTNPLILPPQ